MKQSSTQAMKQSSTQTVGQSSHQVVKQPSDGPMKQKRNASTRHVTGTVADSPAGQLDFCVLSVFEDRKKIKIEKLQ